MNVAVAVEKLEVTIGSTSILHDLDIAIESGSITGLLGPSGAGKTTLMRVLVGLQHPTTGSVQVLGQAPGSKYLRSRIGYMTQNLSIYPDLTVIENLRYFAVICGATQADVQMMIDRLRLSEIKDHPISATSGGQKTRVSLAAALLGKPELLVLDEPTVGIDPLLRAEIWNFLADIAHSGTTLIISSHVMDEASHCDNLVLLRDGTTLATGSPTELKRKTGQHDIESAFLHLVRAKQ